MGRRKKTILQIDFPVKSDAATFALHKLIDNPKQLADHLGCSVQAVNQYRLGQTRPSLDNLCKIADFYGVTTDYLLGRTDDPSLNADHRAVCDLTGLSPDAVDSIIELKKFCPDLIYILSHIIEHPKFESIVDDIDTLNSMQYRIESKGEGLYQAPKSSPHLTSGEPLTNLDYATLLEYRISHTFEAILRSFWQD